MKKNVFFACGLILLAAAGFADPVEGFWKSVDEKTGKVTAGWEIYQQGGRLYGKIIALADIPQDTKAAGCKESYPGFPVAGKVNTMSIVGTPWIFGLVQEKDGQWKDGSIIDPGEGKIYKCKITHRPADGNKFKVETLEMRGEIGLGIGRSQFWRRSTRAEVSAIR